MKRFFAVAVAVSAVSSTGSLAADLKPSVAVNYVRVCNSFGAGFFYIPGSDTCLRIGGYVRYELRTRTAVSRAENPYATFVRSVLDVESFSNSEFGLVHSFFSLRENYQTPSSPTANPLKVYLDQGFVQFGGLSAGLKDSFFDFANGYEHDWEIIGLSNGDSDHKANMLAYTFNFGTKLSATISLEDTTVSILGPIGGPGSTTNPGYGGLKYPDLVGNFTYVDSWGRAMLSGAVHDVNTVTPGVSDRLGFATQASLRLFTPTVGQGDSLILSGSLSSGATKYVMTSLSGFDVNANSNGLTNINPTIDDAYVISGHLRSVRSVAGFAAYQHFWLPNLQTDVFGSYATVTNPAGSTFASSRVWNAGAVLFWDPAPRLRMGPEIQYQNDRLAKVGSTPVIQGDDWRFTYRINRSF